jgi:cold shock CspA family protein
MIEAVRKRYKVGDTITIHTSEASFTGKLDAFEDTCVILITDEGEEFIANEDVKRVSVPKQGLSSTNQITVLSPIIEVEPEVEIIKKEFIKTEIIQQSIDAKPLIPQYKVGDKIPLDILDKRIDKKILINKVKPPKIKGKPTLTLDSLTDLRQLILPELEAENKITVPANGTIKSYISERGFGFILDKNGYEIFFGYSSIIDQQLYDSLKGQNRYANIPVLFSVGKNKKGDKALFVHKPKTVEHVLSLAKKYFDETETEPAMALIEQVLLSFPNNYTAIKLKDEIKNHITKTKNYYTGKSTYKSYDPNYQKATKAKTIDKNFYEAEKYYLLALQNSERRETCIKDIGMLYVSMGEIPKALDFIKKHESELSDNITTYNYLANLFSSLKEFEKVIEYVDLLLNENSILNDKRKYSLYLSQKGFALIQIGELEKAREILEESVSLQRENTYASRLLRALDEPDSDELSQVIADAEFDSFGGGLSKFITDTIEYYNDYFGVPAKIIDSGDFTNETLSAIRKLIDTAGKARPRERANYLMTEVKLMQFLESQKDIRSVLARYCNAMALNHISENSSMDVIRNYYLEAFSLEEDYRFTAPQVALYLISYKSSYSELLTTKTPSIEEALNYVFDGEIKDNIWESILSMFLWNRSISAQITGRLYGNNTFKEKSIIFLKSLGLDTLTNSNIDDYTNIWNQAREKRQRDYSRWLASIKAIYANENIETLANQLYDSLNDAKKVWLTQLDTSRLNTISRDILDVLNQYLRQSGYRDKERFCAFAKAQVNQLISEIKDKPTKFSYEGFIPLLEKIELLLDKSFKTIEAASTPKVKISILGESSVVGNDNIVPFQVTVENSKNSSPIRDVNIIVENNHEISFIDENNKHYDSIDGGENCILKLTVNVSEKVKHDKATTLNIICEYKTRNQEEPISIKEQLSLRLYSEEEFETIENPYAPIADGGPVENKKMFFGRDEFIKNRITAILHADSKQIIIYGQKRSGKSSVLYHLKRGLEETNQTFCVSFSLGLIIKDLNEFTFYHKILSTIERELKLRKAKGEIVPIFICPNLEEFKLRYHTNPANGFIELIEDFKIATLEVEGWIEKKLIIMIDEFTYLYTAIRSGTTSETIMKQWKAVTQSENAKLSVVLVGQDVVPSFKQEDYAKNAFGVIEDIRLTYLEEIDARRLIVEPILDKNENSRFIGRAVDTIIDYTSRNPYYIQIFCARLVDYMNAKKVIRVTEADIKEVAQTFIEGSQALAPEKFDNLIRAGEEHDFKEFDDEPIIKILRQIAIGSKNIGICSRDNISLNDRIMEDRILKHLTDREVLERKQGDNFKIQVKLFQEWLLRH